MAEKAPIDSEIGSFTSVIELRAFIQTEIGRLKEDIDKLYTVTTSHGEGISVQEERNRVVVKTVRELQGRVNSIFSTVEKLEKLDVEDVKTIVSAEIEAAIRRYESKVQIESLNRQLQDIEKPSGPFKQLSDRLDDLAKKVESASTKATSAESDTRDTKTRLTIFIAIGAAIAMKLLDLGFTFLKTLGK